MKPSEAIREARQCLAEAIDRRDLALRLSHAIGFNFQGLADKPAPVLGNGNRSAWFMLRGISQRIRVEVGTRPNRAKRRSKR